MRVAITGAGGFVGRNARVRLREAGITEIVELHRNATDDDLVDAASRSDAVLHLAGVNRPPSEAEFLAGNAGFTERLVRALQQSGRPLPVIYASSIQAALDNPYGRSKRAAEEALLRYSQASQASVYLFRLPNVFGKWSRPNYNSAIATFCHNLARGLPIQIHDPAAPLRLIYVDDVLSQFLEVLQGPAGPVGVLTPRSIYESTVGEVADIVKSFVDSRATLLSARVGTGLVRALYSTYVSFLPPESFAYPVPRHTDPRGAFVEMLKTQDSGQFSYFTSHPGVTRGEHYHHSKTEKFLVIRGKANFGFRNVDTNERYELVVEGGEGRIVETAPGWTHNVTNVGEDELIVMLWANEIFDRQRPDTFGMKVSP